MPVNVRVVLFKFRMSRLKKISLTLPPLFIHSLLNGKTVVFTAGQK